MRKLLIASVMVLFMAGLVCAAEVLVVKADTDKKEVTVKEGEKETTYKYSDKTKFTLLVGKDGDPKEGKLEDFEKRIKGKGGKGGNKIDITVKDGEITEAKFRAGGGKKQ
jgi:hypothetical protein